MVNIGVLISGSGTNLQSLIDNIEEGNINGEIKIVISNRKEAFGLIRAKNAGIEALYINPLDFPTEKEYNKKIIEEL
ncbi:MAG: phosphoribosylglycinamide formyltransferase, partial [Tissierellia bacterium]|nr:phosphoribosylglycinamide formyltransferase [Tissierellia bacterium]